MIQQQEQHHQLANNTPSCESMALASKFFHTPFNTTKRNFTNQRKERPYCPHCHTQGHTLENCYKAGNAEPPVCSHCNMSGHMVEKCYKLHGYPPGHKLYKGKVTDSFANQAVLLASPYQEEVSEEKMVFTKEQYLHLMSLIQPKGPLTAAPPTSQTPPNSKTSITPSKMSDHSTSNSTLGLQNIPCSDHSYDSYCFPQNEDTTRASFYSSPASTPKDFELENSHVSSSPIAHDTPSSSPHIALQKSTRNRTAPKYLQDFHYQQVWMVVSISVVL
ncbi:hypothetical protein Peur_071348 [Populus x canadensis]